jgi:hypothetical protein
MKPNGQTRQARGPEHADPAERVRDLFKRYGRTCAQEAGIRLADKPWQDRVDALGRGHCRRYDESTARCSAPARPSGRTTATRAGHDDLAAVLTDSDRPFRLAAALVRLSLTRDPTPHNSTAER